MNPQDTILIVIDVQGKLAGLMHGQERLLANIKRTIQVFQVLNIPILWTEQAPEKIGATVEVISELLLPVAKPICKRCFSCFACPSFRQALDVTNRRQVLLVGIETHVCVYQTARDLFRFGYRVSVAGDAVSSRFVSDKDAAIERMRQEGMTISSVEMAVTELLFSAGHPKFKEVMAYVKG